jgi:predicted nucleotidyltransferase/DNA-binding transcriptional ArsR family regulator
MLEGTEREVLKLLLERPHSPTEVADELDVSVQTASRNLKQLVEREFAERTRDGEGRGYKRYRVKEFAQVFAGYGGELLDRTLPLTVDKQTVLSVWKVPQPEFHPILLAYIFVPLRTEGETEVSGIIVYGSVARGEASADSDIDLLIVCEDKVDTNEIHGKTGEATGGRPPFSNTRVVSEEWFTLSEFHDGLDAGSQFLRNVLDEGIVLYDPEGVIWDAKRERAGERVPQ